MDKVKQLENLLWMAKCNNSPHIKEYERLLYKEMNNIGLKINKDYGKN